MLDSDYGTVPPLQNGSDYGTVPPLQNGEQIVTAVLTCFSEGWLKSLSMPLLSFLCTFPLSTTSHTSTFTVSLVTGGGKGKEGGRREERGREGMEEGGREGREGRREGGRGRNGEGGKEDMHTVCTNMGHSSF